jgi:hypothetical protein
MMEGLGHVIRMNNLGWLRKLLKVRQNVGGKWKSQTEMAGRCREWFTRAKIEEATANHK